MRRKKPPGVVWIGPWEVWLCPDDTVALSWHVPGPRYVPEFSRLLSLRGAARLGQALLDASKGTRPKAAISALNDSENP